MNTTPAQKQDIIEVRYKFPEDVHKKIRTHKRQLSAIHDRNVSMEAACIDYIQRSELKP